MAVALHKPKGATGDVALREQIPVGMRMLSPSGLSEQWLLRTCGDIHWEMIAQALGQQDTVFHDAEGRAVYAAFCATDIQLERPRKMLLGTSLDIRSSLHTVAANRIGSEHHFSTPSGALGTLRMISCFLRHDGSGSNRKLLRSHLPGMATLPPASQALDNLHKHARLRARYMRATRPDGDVLLRHIPVPALDFNAVGLLYFPTFSKLAEMARPSASPLARRTVTYLGNLDSGDEAIVRRDRNDLALLAGDAPLASIETKHWR